MVGDIMYGLTTVVACLLLNQGLCQFNFEIKEYNGLKYLKFHNPCTPDDTYCPLTCSQKYRATETGVCVQCVCKDGNSGIASPLTTTPPLPSTAHYAVVISHGHIYLQLITPCEHSPSLCPAECTVDTESYEGEAINQCQFCNCSLVTSSSPNTSPSTLASSTLASPIPTTTLSREIVMINGVANLLVDMPCTPRDNVCPVTGCYVDGVVRNSELCFSCQCATKPISAKPTSTVTPTQIPPTRSGSGSTGKSKDTLMVDGVLKIVVTDPCRSSDNLCPVEGCTVDLTSHGADVCFECTCRTVSTSASVTPEPITTHTTEVSALQTMKVGETVYTLLSSPCTPKDNLCLTTACHIEANVMADRNVCFSCVC